MISANGGLPAHRYTPQVTPRWLRGSEPASQALQWKATLCTGLTPHSNSQSYKMSTQDCHAISQICGINVRTRSGNCYRYPCRPLQKNTTNTTRLLMICHPMKLNLSLCQSVMTRKSSNRRCTTISSNYVKWLHISNTHSEEGTSVWVGS